MRLWFNAIRRADWGPDSPQGEETAVHISFLLSGLLELVIFDQYEN